jgi:hypothetical protein
LKKNQEELLEEIRGALEGLNAKIDRMLETEKNVQREGLENMADSLDLNSLFSIPDHLRKTLMVLIRLREATAKEVALQTNRTRAVESGYLNQLVTMGYMKKERKGRKAYFFVNNGA